VLQARHPGPIIEHVRHVVAGQQSEVPQLQVFGVPNLDGVMEPIRAEPFGRARWSWPSSIDC
jgi:hypothetical protein